MGRFEDRLAAALRDSLESAPGSPDRAEVASTSREDRGAVGPHEVAAALRESMEADTEPLDPESVATLLDLARWGRDYGLVEPAMREALDGPKAWGPKLAPWWRPKLKDQADWVGATWAPRNDVSPHPARWDELVEGVAEVKRKFLTRKAERMEACGSVWWSSFVVRLFWRDRKGRDRLRRQLGIHRCKCAWCPVCGRSRQAQLSAQIEKVLTLLRDFGLDEGHARLVTLTSPNGSDVRALREATHEAFAKLQRTRWWNRYVFGFVRGSEVKTGEDGAWNFHIHLVVVFWSDRVSYQQIGDVWSRELGSVIGDRADGKRFVVDVEELESRRWNRKDGKDGQLKRKGSLARAARYITKYLTKGEELKNLRKGPGGLARLELGTHRMRRFAMGGGCAVVRRASKVLMPAQVFQAEEIINGARLHDGRAPWRAELLDPSTGEVRAIESEAPLVDEHGAGLEAWGRALATDDAKAPARWKLPPKVVGEACGPRGRYRRLGKMPLGGPGITVAAFEKGAAQVGIRAMVAEGRWQVFRWSEVSKKTAKLLKFACVLPAVRYSWRPVWEAMKRALQEGVWAMLRKRAGQEGGAAALAVADLPRVSHLRTLHAELDDRVWRNDYLGEPYRTSIREEKAVAMRDWAVSQLLKHPRAAWDEAVQRARCNADALDSTPNLLSLSNPNNALPINLL